MLQDIQRYIQEGISKVNEYIYQSLQREDPSIQQFVDYLLQKQGKQIRPRFVLTVAVMLGERITEKTLRGAALISILHHASLIHDDVIDEASYRRHVKTFNVQWNNKLAVLFGDYLLATVLRIAVENNDYDYLAMLAKTAQAMSEGEILQLTRINGLSVSEVAYLHIIQQKTASLLGTACAIGAISVAASSTQIETLYTVGEQLGMAFQLRDDMLDYQGSVANTGKAPLMDLKEKKLTLPLIYALQQAQPSEAEAILHKIHYHIEDTETLQQVGAFVHRLGGIDYTLKKMLDYREKALQILKNNVKPSVYQETLISLIEEILRV
ncbi:MAG: hypothetical protein BGO68_01620 [Candidatus Amoebophilus sp. 36-38]|nr:MAG: hypothetical protein BGO68_01620 [Candidatus Amoebophilus sp. 36-38]